MFDHPCSFQSGFLFEAGRTFSDVVFTVGFLAALGLCIFLIGAAQRPKGGDKP